MRAWMRWALLAVVVAGCSDNAAPDTTPRLHNVILFTSDRSAGGFQLHTMASDGSGIAPIFVDTVISHTASKGRPTISPDGEWIAFSMVGDIWVARADGTEPRNLTDAPGSDEYPAWSPDGSRIAFESDRDGDWDIYLITPDGTGLVQLTDENGRDDTPSWSPGGERLAFSSDRTGDLDIFTVVIATGEVLNLTQDPGSDYMPAWSHDGTTIAFGSTRDRGNLLYLMDADGSNVRSLMADFNASFPAWDIGDTILSFEGIPADRDIWTVRRDGTGLVNLIRDAAPDGSPVWAP